MQKNNETENMEKIETARRGVIFIFLTKKLIYAEKYVNSQVVCTIEKACYRCLQN